MSYNPRDIELKWQKIWEEDNRYLCDVHDFSKPKYYVLDMFPYPSAQGLHVGHVEGYTATDVLARYKRANGYNVLHPMGFDSFGLPAEQFAIKNNKNPGPFTENNIDNFRRQLKRCGFSYDWSKEIHTSSPDFYKWTQWVFVKMYEKGLAYLSNKPVNYCPALGTVLANEEVIDGKSERGGFPVIRQNMEQWNLKITSYASRLLDDLKLLDWPSSTLEMQRNWIGQSYGVEIDFSVHGKDNLTFTVFTTRVDTLFGCTYCVLAPEHPLVESIVTVEYKDDVEKYIEATKNKSDFERTEVNKSKTGVFTGSYAINPINGKAIPIYIGDYVLGSYGSGAVMAVPAHDQRDYEFAKKHNLEVIKVIESDISKEAYEGDGVHINSSYADGKDIAGAKKIITERLVELNSGRKKVNYKLRDWLFSRQRYWGDPIPMIKLDDGRYVPEKIENLPVKLPDLDDYKPQEGVTTPLSKAKDFVEVTVDGVKGKRETNVMPQWAGSSIYYMRFIDPHNENEIGDKKLLDHWLPVDQYVGGPEHAVLHLLYARFWHKFLKDIGVVSSDEPFKALKHPGMILGSDGEKMSKSRGNVVNPDDTIEKYGADALRLYELFKGPIDQSLPWSDEGVNGARRFIERIYRLYTEDIYKAKHTDEKVPELDKVFHQTIKKVTEDIEILHFNTAISAMMIFVNSLYKAEKLNNEMLDSFLVLFAPFCPHVASELYSLRGHKEQLDFVPWPKFDENSIQEDNVSYAVQVNGKLKGLVTFAKDNEDKDSLYEEALKIEQVKKALEGKTIIKTIFVKNKILNIVVK
ncbi:MAG TPA: leucine--tRNA ligase [Firmicutes bacterium]|nr:leucine--tRNA ligase [Bacillota bacterium]